MRNKITIACAVSILSTIPPLAIADPRQDCIAGGKVFQDAMTSEMMLIAYNESIDWRRVDYYMLPKEIQDRIETDLDGMKSIIPEVVAATQRKIPEWKRQGLDGDSIARQALIGGMKNVGEEFAVSCLKDLQDGKST